VFEQEDLVGLDGSVVLVGDAAHSVLVGFAQIELNLFLNPLQIHGSHNSSMAASSIDYTYLISI
jgi:hypothetical protein